MPITQTYEKAFTLREIVHILAEEVGKTYGVSGNSTLSSLTVVSGGELEVIKITISPPKNHAIETTR